MWPLDRSRWLTEQKVISGYMSLIYYYFSLLLYNKACNHSLSKQVRQRCSIPRISPVLFIYHIICGEPIALNQLMNSLILSIFSYFSDVYRWSFISVCLRPPLTSSIVFYLFSSWDQLLSLTNLFIVFLAFIFLLKSLLKSRLRASTEKCLMGKSNNRLSPILESNSAAEFWTTKPTSQSQSVFLYFYFKLLRIEVSWFL